MLSLVIACAPCAVKCLDALEQEVLTLGSVRKIQGLIWHLDTIHSVTFVRSRIEAHTGPNHAHQVINVTYLDADAVIHYLQLS